MGVANEKLKAQTHKWKLTYMILRSGYQFTFFTNCSLIMLGLLLYFSDVHVFKQTNRHTDWFHSHANVCSGQAYHTNGNVAIIL